MLVLSLASVFCYFMRQRYKDKWFRIFTENKRGTSGTAYNYYGERVTKDEAQGRFDVRKNHISRYFVVEVMLLLMCPLPWFEYYVEFPYVLSAKNNRTGVLENIVIKQFLSDFIMCFMFFRIFFGFRAIFNYSIYSDAYSRKVCKYYDFYPGFRFILKSNFISNPVTTIVTLFSLSVINLAFLLRVFELRFCQYPDTNNLIQSDGRYFFSIYTVIITMTTVGYGDNTPETDPGKFICCFTALWGAFMVSLLVLLVSKFFSLEKH